MDFLALATAWAQQKPQVKLLQQQIKEKQASILNDAMVLASQKISVKKAEIRVVKQIQDYVAACIVRMSSRAKVLIREAQKQCTLKRDSLQYKREQLLRVSLLVLRGAGGSCLETIRHMLLIHA